MKKLLILAGLIAAVGASAQGTIDFRNRIANNYEYRIHVAPAPPSTATRVGSLYQAALYWGTGATAPDEASLQPAKVGGNYYTVSLADGLGTFTANPLAVDGFAGGQTYWVQVRVWEKSGGATWEAASRAAEQGAIIRGGKSNIFTTSAGGPVAGFPDALPGNLKNWTPVEGLVGFYVSPIPEPSIMGLGLIGGAALLLRRRS